ncbi:MAG: 5'-methylthioadenosine nucleosidase [Salinibacter sp.]
MLGLVFATPDEAAPFVERITGGERPDNLEEGCHVEAHDVVVTVTGPGKIKAAIGVERFLRQHDVDTLVHAGGATALTDDLELGTLVGATFVLEGDRVALDTPTYPRMPLDPLPDLSTEGALVSQDHTNDGDSEERSYWERIADLRDDTGYPVAYVAAQHGTTCHIVKGVTGRVDTEDPSSVRRKAYQAVASFLRNHVETTVDGGSA